MSQLTDNIDSQIATLLPTLSSLQESYLQANGVYFQGLPHGSAVPSDGAAANPDKWDNEPSYQTMTWRQFWGSPPTLSCQISIDQYVSPEGPGWVFGAKVTQAGMVMVRRVNSGPNSWYEQAWGAEAVP